MNKLLLIAALAASTMTVSAQKDTTAVDTFRFTTIKENKITPVKNQASSGTCWSFSALGFFEADFSKLSYFALESPPLICRKCLSYINHMPTKLINSFA